jgi:hypothetical protein
LEQFGLGTEPILHVVTEPPSIILEDLERSASGRVIGLLYPIEEIASGKLFDWHGRRRRL